MDWDDLVMSVFVVGVLAAVIVAGMFGVAQWSASNACTRAGYPQSRVLVPSFTAYCIKRVNQTDTVVPLSQVHP